jgi:Leucine-rich repeat (LRR) protein
MLTSFRAIENTLTTLPPEIGSLTNLAELFLQNNHLKELPASLGQLRQLRWLNISDNDLHKLPQSLGRLHGKLSTFICANVKLTDERSLDLAWLAKQPPGMIYDLPKKKKKKKKY